MKNKYNINVVFSNGLYLIIKNNNYVEHCNYISCDTINKMKFYIRYLNNPKIVYGIYLFKITKNNK